VRTCPNLLVGADRRMQGLSFFVNPSPGHECDTRVRVQPASWGRVKALYSGAR
jgi:hypothetical protein